MKEGLNFNRWYKSRFEELSEEPPKEVWDNISEELSIEEVWGNLSATLEHNKRAGFPTKTLYTAIILFLLIGSTWLLMYENKYFRKDKANKGALVTQPSKTSKQTGGKEDGGKNATSNTISGTTRKGTNISDGTTAFINLSTTGEDKADNEYVKENLIKNNFISSTSGDVISREEFRYIAPVILDKLYTPVNSHDSLNMLLSATDSITFSKIGSIPKGIYAGGFVSFNNTWLLNQRTRYGLKRESTNNTSLTFGKSYGAVCDINISNSVSIGIELAYVTQGQRYGEYTEGHFFNRKTTLKYLLIAAEGKYKTRHIFKGKYPASINIIAGPYLGYLSQIKINDIIVTSSDYSYTDYGFNIGLEYEILLKKRLLFSPGFRFSKGIKNINRGYNDAAADFNKSHNLSAGAMVSFKYLLREKK